MNINDVPIPIRIPIPIPNYYSGRYVNINDLPTPIRIPIHQRGLSLLKHEH